MLVTLRIVRIDAFNRNGELDGTFGGIGLVEDHLSGQGVETTVKDTNQVFDTKYNRGMHGIDLEGVGVCREPCGTEQDSQDEFGCFHFMRFLRLVVSRWFLELLPAFALEQSLPASKCRRPGLIHQI